MDTVVINVTKKDTHEYSPAKEIKIDPERIKMVFTEGAGTKIFYYDNQRKRIVIYIANETIVQVKALAAATFQDSNVKSIDDNVVNKDCLLQKHDSIVEDTGTYYQLRFLLYNMGAKNHAIHKEVVADLTVVIV